MSALKIVCAAIKDSAIDDNTTKTREPGYYCAECDGGPHESVPTRSVGDESWWVCPDCGTIEGRWIYSEDDDE